MQLNRQMEEIPLERLSLGRDRGTAWVVYKDNMPAEVVWFDSKYSEKEVWNSLVYMDGYAVEIEIKKPS
jgi:hypothetical protein